MVLGSSTYDKNRSLRSITGRRQTAVVEGRSGPAPSGPGLSDIMSDGQQASHLLAARVLPTMIVVLTERYSLAVTLRLMVECDYDRQCLSSQLLLSPQYGDQGRSSSMTYIVPFDSHNSRTLDSRRSFLLMIPHGANAARSCLSLIRPVGCRRTASADLSGA